MSIRTPLAALAALLAVVLAPLSAFAAKGQVTVLFTGDNGGEVSPCG